MKKFSLGLAIGLSLGLATVAVASDDIQFLLLWRVVNKHSETICTAPTMIQSTRTIRCN